MSKLLEQITDSLYKFKDTCNVYMIKNKESCVLIDFGSGKILDELPEVGVSHIEAVLITHHHRDQVQGLALANNNNIPIFVPHSEQDLIALADNMWQRREISNNYNNRQDRFSILESVSINGTLKDYSKIMFAGHLFTVLPTPGHTPGSVSLIVDLDSKKYAFTGDLIYASGKVWSLAATQWTYNGGEGLPFSVVSLLSLLDEGAEFLLPSHGYNMKAKEAIPPTVDALARLIKHRRQNPRLFELRQNPYQQLTEHLLFNRTSMSNSYVLISKSKKALILDYGYDFMAGVPAGTDRSARRPWLFTIPTLMRDYEIETIDACLPTHYHDDHVAGFNILRDTYGTKVMCPENFADILENPTAYDIPCLWYDPIPVDIRLPLSTTIEWEEYNLTLHPLSGHTRYSVAIEFEADGKKIICGGDQYADDDGLFCNYVYKNMFEPEDFTLSAALYASVKPDIILTGHWLRFVQSGDYFKELERRGKELDELHNTLLPREAYKSESTDFCAIFYPYRLNAYPSETVAITVNIKNPLTEYANITASLVLPEGFYCETSTLTAPIEAQESISLSYNITVTSVPTYRARIGCDITANDWSLGQQAEMLITVCR